MTHPGTGDWLVSRCLPHVLSKGLSIGAVGPDRTVIEHWDASALSKLPKDAFANDFAYNQFAAGPYGIRASMGAAATVTLPVVPHTSVPPGMPVTLRLTDVDGRSFATRLERIR
ncbi:TQO small subunit DoxA domain-containing protein [Paraburkholderia sp. RL17-337-BIB-A]|uniref:TQO small subunit DoxA domain-containing protein n=1 Tax=Paraburkholderia sp. RL17-337-BIB-A TaxID=3031636 RepID=UPI0038B84839